MIYLLTTRAHFRLMPGESVVRYSPDLDYRQFVGENLVVVGRTDRADKLVAFLDDLLIYKPATLAVWVVDSGRWVSVTDETGRWIADVPPPDDIFDEVRANAGYQR